MSTTTAHTVEDDTHAEEDSLAHLTRYTYGRRKTPAAPASEGGSGSGSRREAEQEVAGDGMGDDGSHGLHLEQTVRESYSADYAGMDADENVNAVMATALAAAHYDTSGDGDELTLGQTVRRTSQTPHLQVKGGKRLIDRLDLTTCTLKTVANHGSEEGLARMFSLPLDIVARIIGYLHPRDILTLSLTCKWVYVFLEAHKDVIYHCLIQNRISRTLRRAFVADFPEHPPFSKEDIDIEYKCLTKGTTGKTLNNGPRAIYSYLARDQEILDKFRPLAKRWYLTPNLWYHLLVSDISDQKALHDWVMFIVKLCSIPIPVNGQDYDMNNNHPQNSVYHLVHNGSLAGSFMHAGHRGPSHTSNNTNSESNPTFNPTMNSSAHLYNKMNFFTDAGIQPSNYFRSDIWFVLEPGRVTRSKAKGVKLNVNSTASSSSQFVSGSQSSLENLVSRNSHRQLGPIERKSASSNRRSGKSVSQKKNKSNATNKSKNVRIPNNGKILDTVAATASAQLSKARNQKSSRLLDATPYSRSNNNLSSMGEPINLAMYESNASIVFPDSTLKPKDDNVRVIRKSRRHKSSISRSSEMMVDDMDEYTYNEPDVGLDRRTVTGEDEDITDHADQMNPSPINNEQSEDEDEDVAEVAAAVDEDDNFNLENGLFFNNSTTDPQQAIPQQLAPSIHLDGMDIDDFDRVPDISPLNDHHVRHDAAIDAMTSMMSKVNISHSVSLASMAVAAATSNNSMSSSMYSNEDSSRIHGAERLNPSGFQTNDSQDDDVESIASSTSSLDSSSSSFSSNSAAFLDDIRFISDQELRSMTYRFVETESGFQEFISLLVGGNLVDLDAMLVLFKLFKANKNKPKNGTAHPFMTGENGSTLASSTSTRLASFEMTEDEDDDMEGSEYTNNTDTESCYNDSSSRPQSSRATRKTRQEKINEMMYEYLLPRELQTVIHTRVAGSLLLLSWLVETLRLYGCSCVRLSKSSPMHRTTGAKYVKYVLPMVGTDRKKMLLLHCISLLKNNETFWVDRKEWRNDSIGFETFDFEKRFIRPFLRKDLKLGYTYQRQQQLIQQSQQQARHLRMFQGPSYLTNRSPLASSWI